MYKVSEFAKTTKDIKQLLGGGSMTTCIEHLVKLAILDSPQNVNHWRQEVYASMHELPKLKSTGKYPTSDWIYQQIWDYYGDDLAKYFDIAIKEELGVNLKANVTADKIVEPLSEYISWLSTNLSNQGKIDRESSYTKLKSLGL